MKGLRKSYANMIKKESICTDYCRILHLKIKVDHAPDINSSMYTGYTQHLIQVSVKEVYIDKISHLLKLWEYVVALKLFDFGQFFEIHLT